MHNQRLTLIIASGLGILGGFLPWANVPFFGAIYGMSGDGKITFALFAVCAVFALLGDKKKSLSGGKLNAVIGLAALATAMGIWKIVDLKQAFNSVEDNLFAAAISKSVSVGIGLYLIVAAGIVAIIGGLALRDKKSTVKSL